MVFFFFLFFLFLFLSILSITFVKKEHISNAMSSDCIISGKRGKKMLQSREQFNFTSQFPQNVAQKKLQHLNG